MNRIVLISVAAIMLAGCEGLFGSKDGDAALDVQNSYKPIEGRQISRIDFEGTSVARSYTFEYDALGRIKTATWTQTDDEKTTTRTNTYTYTAETIVAEINNTKFTCYLDEEGKVTKIEKGNSYMEFTYTPDSLLTSAYYETKVMTRNFSMKWSSGNFYSTTGDAINNSRSFNSFENKTNLDLGALITNSHAVFEGWLTNSDRIPFGTFGFLGKVSVNFPSMESYNEGRSSYSYKMDENGYPVEITSGSGKYTLTYKK